MTKDKNSAESEPNRQKGIILRLLKIAWRYRGGCLKAIAIQIVMLMSSLFGLKFVGVGIDFIRKTHDNTSPNPVWPFGLEPPSNWSYFGTLFLIASLGIIFAVLQYILNYLDKMNKARFLQKGLVVDLRSEVYDKMQRLSFRFYDSKTSGALINRVTSDVQSVRLFVDGVIIQAVGIVISFSVYLSYMFLMNVRLTLACMATFPFIFGVSWYFSRRLKPAYQRSRGLIDDLIMKIVEFVNGIHVIKGFAREEYELAKLRKYNEAVKEHNMKIFWMVSVFNPLVSFLSQISIVVLLIYGGYLVAYGEFPLGSGLIVFLGLVNRLSDQINASVGIIDNLQQSFVAAGRVFEVLDAPLSISSPKNPIAIKRVKGAISFKNVYFEYEPGEKILENISLDIKPGEFIGILGAIGSGKSTLLSLIPRFYDPSMGVVMIDGYDIRRLKLDDLRRQIGIVFQESFLFSKSISANIAFGKPDANFAEIERAAKLAAADEFISELPQKYNTVISESGADLSGGQRQRLALARAILFDPPILLLDDPAASVDSQTEKEILNGIEGAMADRTTILVSNRISALKKAARIYVLQKGKIIQSGSHDELMNQKGYYRKTAEIQECGLGLLDPEPTPRHLEMQKIGASLK